MPKVVVVEVSSSRVNSVGHRKIGVGFPKKLT